MKPLCDCQITLSLLLNIMRFHLKFIVFYVVFQKTNSFFTPDSKRRFVKFLIQ